MSRRDARERAFQLLYQLSIQQGNEEQQIGEFLSNMGDYHDKEHKIEYSEDDRSYILKIAGGYRFHREDLDAAFAPFLKDWTKDRLPKVDLAILRLAVCELKDMPDVPLNVTINEAVLLAKRYAAPESRSYINAVLGRLEKSANDFSADPEEEKVEPNG